MPEGSWLTKVETVDVTSELVASDVLNRETDGYKNDSNQLVRNAGALPQTPGFIATAESKLRKRK